MCFDVSGDDLLVVPTTLSEEHYLKHRTQQGHARGHAWALADASAAAQARAAGAPRRAWGWPPRGAGSDSKPESG